MYIDSLQATEGDNRDLEVTNQHQEMASEQMTDHSKRKKVTSLPKGSESFTSKFLNNYKDFLPLKLLTPMFIQSVEQF